MTTIVVDASAVAALLFVEDEGAAMARAFGDAHLVAPFLLEYELANICIKKSRREPARSASLREAHATRLELGVEVLRVDHGAVLALAFSTGLTGYDASYLWLAEHLDVELVTLDRELQKAARRHLGGAGRP